MKCPTCGQAMALASYKVTAGYYSNLNAYVVKAHSPNEAEAEIRAVVKRTIHPEADVVKVEKA